MTKSVVLFVIFIIYSTNFVKSEDWPRIRVQKGHLQLVVEHDKNISFVTSGTGAIHVNGQDLVHITNMATNLSNALTSMQFSGGPTLPDGSPMELDKSVFTRLAILENQLSNITTTMASKQSITRLNRRINLMQRRIRRINNILTQNECDANPCQNGGTCQDLYNSYMCICPAAWEGPTCSEDVNECAAFAGTDLGCQNGATCINKPGTYMCSCANGWIGVHCTKKEADCSQGGIDLCGHGTCVPQSNAVGYKCICDQGWTTDGKTPPCNLDVNECDTFPCSKTPLVQCINVPGSFFCAHCPPGYTGNGYHCNDINECETYNGGCSMNPMVLCINTPGSRTCGLCPPNYVGDGATCTYAGSTCSVNNGGCHPLAICSHTPGTLSTFVVCTCPPGYIGAGVGPNGCLRVQTPPACVSNPCVHGTCAAGNSTTDYSCICTAGYSGRNCETARNPCEVNPCQNGGTCFPARDGYYCRCTSDFTGTNCERNEAACGGILNGESGQFEYPASQGRYMYRQNCAWVISANSSKVLNVTFTYFKIRKSSSCQFDWVQIHDGRNTAAPSIGRFCGDDLPNNGTIISNTHNIYIWYRGDANIASTSDKFALSWTSTDPVCGGEIAVKSHGVIKSPGFPGHYPNNRDCYWTMKAPLDKRIEFHFFSLMIGQNADCSKDYVSFYSMGETEPFANFCNTTHPPPLTAPAPSVRIHFHSDNDTTYPGFQISYTIIGGIPNCGGVYTEDSDIIQTQLMNTNFQYSMTYECDYKIIVNKKMRIQLQFTAFDIMKMGSTCLEHVTIYEGGSAEGPVIGKYCGNKPPPPITSLGNQLLLVYKSRTSRGFTLKYDTVCGAIYTESEGVIQTTGHPATQTSRRSCIYEIVQSPGVVITLNIMNMTLNSRWTCLFGGVEVRDGDNKNATLIGTYCKDAPITMVSTHNHLWIKHYQNQFSELYINYTTTDLQCGGIMKDKIGTIQSPSHPSYPSKTVCTWMIVAPQGKVIQLSWLSFKLEQGYECNYDYVEVYDNNTIAGMGGKMGRYCGSKTPPVLLSSSNIMTVIFKSDATVNHEGFIASYTSMDADSVCGAMYFTSSGVIRSPNYPSSYPVNKDCKWIIQVPPGNQIMLNVSAFQLEFYTNCRYDFLEIRNGGTGASPLIGKFCGGTIPKLIPSHANQLYLHFKSDMTRSAQGFEIYWQSTSTGCGGTLTSPKGSIISPNYPEPYSKSTDCLWKISINPGSVIQLVFADIDLENHIICRLDYVEIFDGIDATAKSLGRYCNSAHPPFFTASGNHVLVKFRSDISYQGRGFQLQYSTVCNNKVTGYSGVIESPNFPNGYSQNQDCLWEIGVSAGNKINLTFSQFQLERSLTLHQNSCEYDYVEIKYYNHYEENLVKYGSFCGDSAPPPITINANNTQIHFVTDSLLMGAGFRLEWQIFGCGGILTRPEGTIETTNYPNAYPNNTNCEWIIRLPEVGKSVVLTFDKLDLEHSDGCMFDYIEVYNGHDANGQFISRLCHTVNSTVITSTGHEMFVLFVSDFSYEGRGFQANYKTVDSKCGGTFNTDSGFITSPNYPKNYGEMASCEWLITVSPSQIIDFTVVDLDLVKNCQQVDVKVYDGVNEAYPLLTTLCGSQKPNGTIKSSHNHLFVKMTSRTTMTAKGFKAEFKTACGAVLQTETSGLISYVHHNYDYDGECTFTIIAPTPGDHVSLTITYINEQYCGMFFPPLYVYNGDNSSSPLIGTYCEKIPPTITSDGSALHITTNSGFRASYTTYSSTCGGTLEHENGYFASPNYPNDYPSDIECEWTLSISKSLSISVSFSTFDIVQSDHCNDDFLEVRDTDNSGKLLGIFCGNNAPTNLTNVGPLWIYFKSTKSDIGALGQKKKGFMAEYNIGNHADLIGESGSVYSPLYPDYYMKSGDFTWRITVKFGYKIAITSQEFYVEYNDIDNFCLYGSVSFYDGYDDTAPNLGTDCGSKSFNYKSSSNIIYVKAAFDIVRKGSKFVLEWLQIESVSPIVPPKSSSLGCGATEIIDINSLTNYTIQSPGYPNGYASDLNCTWIFSTVPQNHLVLTFNDIKLENRFHSCFYDKVNIYSGIEDSPNWKLVKSACLLNDSSTKYETTNLMKVVFKSDRFYNQSGFEATVTQQCGGSINDRSGQITIPLKKHWIEEPVMECQWNVTVRSGRTMEITFKNFDLGTNRDGGCKNYIILRNGQYADSPMLGEGKYCGRNGPTKLETTGNHLYVKLAVETEIPGFILEYKEVSMNCGGTLSLTNIDNSTTITSPNYPNIPLPHTECLWTIRAPPGESLQIDFVDRFDLTEDRNCVSEYVELRNGGTHMSPLIGKFCNELPSTQTTTDHMVFIKFFTEVDEPKNGFKAVVSIKKCGGVIRGSTGELFSPFYGSKDLYPQNMECTWELIGPRDHYLILTAQAEGLNCERKGSVELFDFNLINNTNISMGKFCHSNTLLYSASNKVTVKFTSGTGRQTGFHLQFNTSQEECGGKLTAESGFIESPGYPVMNHNERSCEWNIEVPKGRSIKVEVLDLDLDASVNLYEQGIAFFNDDDFSSHIKYLKSGDKAKFIHSTDNKMSIYFWSSHESNHRGFRLKYTSDEPTVCVGDFSKPSGIIYAPQNISRFSCSWLRQDNPPAQRTVTLRISTKQSAQPSVPRECRQWTSSLTITTKISNDENTLSEYCSVLKKPAVVRVPYLNVNILNSQGPTAEALNFTIQYSSQNCGGILTEAFGTIKSPNKEQGAADITYDCVWVIQFPDEQGIRLNFTKMELSDNCEQNFLTIHNGPLRTSPKIGAYCRNNSPGIILSESNALWIEYHYDVAAGGKGFQLNYEPTVGGCGGIFYNTNRILQSPGYPSDYPNNAECVWELRADNGYHLGLEFKGRFHLETSDSCDKDYVEVFDNIDDKWKSLGKFCGRDPPVYLNSTSSKMKVVFRSNGQSSGSGFMATWRWNCGGNFLASSSQNVITSPGYPNDYKSNLLCVYNISAPGKEINIIFEDFRLEFGSNDCKFDSLRISEVFWRSNLSSVYCGDTLPPPRRSYNNVILTFKTDSYLTRRGFKFTYGTDSCGGVITEPTEIKNITFLARFGLYMRPSNYRCKWNVTAPDDKIVVVRIEKLNLYYTRYCSANYLAFYDGLKVNFTNRLAKLCGNLTDSISVIKSSGNQMVIDYSAVSRRRHGNDFNAVVYFSYGPSMGCGGTVYLNDTGTKTINGPALWDVDCHWQIETMDGYYLSLKFTDVESCNGNVPKTLGNCACSSFEIKDGGGPFSETIDTFCEEKPTTAYSTSGSRAWVRWQTNEFTQKRGFKLEVTPVLSLCGPSMVLAENSTKTIKSPNFPQPYPSNVKCVWRIKSPKTFRNIHLKFVSFDLGDMPEHAKDCSDDRVEISDKYNTKIIQEGLGSGTIFSGQNNYNFVGYRRSPIGVHQYCGKKGTEFDYYSGQNDVTVSFTSGSGNHGKGFNLEYTTIGCNRNYTDVVQGRVVNDHLDGSTCIILISTPPGTTISIYFVSFHIYDMSTSCTNNKFEVYDGPTTSSPQLSSLCGFRIPSPIFSTQNQVMVRAISGQGTGVILGSYDFTFTSTDQGRGCGGVMYNYRGTFTSPMYPDSYRNISDCTWTVNIPYGLDSVIKFSQFDIKSACESNYLLVTTYQGGQPSEHKYCENDVPPVLRSSSKIAVRYVTSYHNGGLGWVAHFASSTGGQELYW